VLVVVTPLTDSPEPPILAANVPEVALVKVTTCDVVFPPTAAVRVMGFGDHVIPLVVPLFTTRLTVIVT